MKTIFLIIISLLMLGFQLSINPNGYNYFFIILIFILILYFNDIEQVTFKGFQIKKLKSIRDETEKLFLENCIINLNSLARPQAGIMTTYGHLIPGLSPIPHPNSDAFKETIESIKSTLTKKTIEEYSKKINLEERIKEAARKFAVYQQHLLEADQIDESEDNLKETRLKEPGEIYHQRSNVKKLAESEKKPRITKGLEAYELMKGIAEKGLSFEL